jgi:PAS domain S-box-containing protein
MAADRPECPDPASAPRPAAARRARQDPADLAGLFDLSPDLLAIASARDGRWLRVNPAFTRVLGWSEAELLETPYLAIVHPDDRPHATSAEATLAAGEPLEEFEQRVLCKDGSVRWIAWQTTPHAERGLVYCVGRDITEARDRATRQAHEQELLQKIFDTIPVLLVVWDPALQRFTVNREFTDVLGWTDADANSGDLMARVYPDPAYRQQVAAYMQSLQPGWREWLCTARDGRAVPIDWSNVQLADRTMVGIGVDLQSRKRAERALRRSELAQSRHRRFLQTLLDHAGICIAVVQGPDLRFTLVNDAYQALRPTVPMVGHRFGEVFPELVGRSPETDIQRVLRTGQPQEGTGIAVPVPDNPDAVWDHRLVRLPLTPEEKPAVLVMSWEVTDRVRVHEALAASEQHLRLVLENSRDGIHQLDLTSDRYVYMSPAQTDLTGFSREELLGMSATEATRRLHPDDRAAVRAYLERVIGGEEPAEPMQYRWRVKSGEYRWFSDSRRLIRDAAGQPQSLVGVSRDITARKAAEEALQRATTDLEQRVAERTEEVRAQADQLRALASQLSQAELLERKRLAGVLHDHLQQLIVSARMQAGRLRPDLPAERFERTVGRLGDILQEALQASRDLTLDLSPPALHDAGLSGGLNWLASRMRQQHGFTVTVRCDPDAEPADEPTRFLLFECARELLFNALKHAGTAEAAVALTDGGEDQIHLEVADAGAGFDPDRLRHRRADEATFGLFSIQERLAHIGGRMDVNSAPGCGTRIGLRAPRGATRPASAPQTAPTPPAPPAPRPRRSDRCRVLIVDDHRIVREGLRELLDAETDLEVVGEAAGGRAAIDLARRLQPDVVVMDVNLPDLDGVDATRQITRAWPWTRVVALSMHTGETVARNMEAAGARAYLAKGGPADDLVAAIRSCREAGA